MMKNTPLVFLAFLAIPFSITQAQDFTVFFDTATPQIQENNIVLDGIRVEGFGFVTENDALKVRFVFNPTTLNFELDAENIIIYPDVGVFHEQLMATDAGIQQPTYTTVEGEIVEIGTEAREFTVTTDTPFISTFDLQIGHVMSWYFMVRTKDIVYQLNGPNINLEKTLLARTKAWESPLKILTPGIYQLTVMPSDPEDIATFQFDAFNLNNRPLIVLADGDRIKESFNHPGEYAKFQVTLNKGDTLEIPGTKDENIAIKLVDKTSHVIANAENGNDLTYQQTTQTNDYYLFIYQKNEGKSRYSGKISMTAEKKNTPKPDKNTEQPDTESEPDNISENGNSELENNEDSGNENSENSLIDEEPDEENVTENSESDDSNNPLTENSDNEESENTPIEGDGTETSSESDPNNVDLDEFFDRLEEELNNS